MKRIIVCVFSLFIICSAFAQLNITSSGSKNETFYKDTWSTVTWNGKAFMFNSSDPVTGLTLSFTLGNIRSSAVTTLNQIFDFLEESESKSFITFEDNGKEITLYKIDSYELGISNGDAEYIRKETSRRISGALLGTQQYSKKDSTPHYSFIKRKALVESIETLTYLSDPKYLGEDYENDPMYKQMMAQKKAKEEAIIALEQVEKQIAITKTEISNAKKAKDKDKEKELKQTLKDLQNAQHSLNAFLNPAE